MTVPNPYEKLEARAFWKTAVAEADPYNLEAVYRRKWRIRPQDRIACAGSCFAQHIGRRLRAAGYNVMDVEPPPRHLNEDDYGRFGFGLYSARYGNIYTARQLLQLAQEAAGLWDPGDIVWEREGRYFDALRPNVEPDGLDSVEEVLSHRKRHLRQVRALFAEADLVIFTLGLTETWERTSDGAVFPTAPGAIAGDFDASIYAFRNFAYPEIRKDLAEFVSVVKSVRPTGKPPRLLLTVSPVPLVATASGDHVLAATTYSKSVLRSVAGDLSKARSFVDYFPSFEIVTNQAARGSYFDPNLRTVTREGVEAVMRVFFGQHPVVSNIIPPRSRTSSDESVCEEALIEAYA